MQAAISLSVIDLLTEDCFVGVTLFGATLVGAALEIVGAGVLPA